MKPSPTVARLLFIALLAGLFAGAGCTWRTSYNPSYLPPLSHIGTKAPGRGLLFMNPSDANYVFCGRPHSFTAKGSKFQVPLGNIAHEIAARQFGQMFSEGLQQSSSMDSSGAFTAILQPRVVSFEFKLNRMRNLDFATTPQVNLTIQVSTFDSAGKLVLSPTYDSGWYSGKTVVDTLNPGELIGKATHEAMSMLMAKAAADIERTLPTLRPVPPPAAPAFQPAAAPAPAPVPAAPLSSAPADERLRKLKKLYDDGLISKDAYEAKQQEILNEY